MRNHRLCRVWALCYAGDDCWNHFWGVWIGFSCCWEGLRPFCRCQLQLSQPAALTPHLGTDFQTWNTCWSTREMRNHRLCRVWALCYAGDDCWNHFWGVWIGFSCCWEGLRPFCRCQLQLSQPAALTPHLGTDFQTWNTHPPSPFAPQL